MIGILAPTELKFANNTWQRNVNVSGDIAPKGLICIVERNKAGLTPDPQRQDAMPGSISGNMVEGEFFLNPTVLVPPVCLRESG
jgi:hypothetical protein